MDKTTTNPFAKLLKALSKVEQHEIRATAISFALVMILMTSYYILRPVRDAMASDWSDAEVSLLWTINFFFSFAIVAFYGFAAARVPLNRLVPGVFSFFALTFVIFYLVSHLITDSTLIDKAFYVWVSVYSLFPISVFWSFMADIYRREQSKRLFGIITTGASVGAMIGPSVALLFANLGTYNLMLVATVVLLMTLPLVIYLRTIDFTSQSADASPSANLTPLSNDALAGFKLFFSNPFLIAIGIFLFLYTGIGSFIYFELKNLMAEFSREQRTEIWAFIDLATNSITIIAGLFITSRLATRLGLGFTLALLPLVVFAGLLSVAMVPLLSVVIGLQIFRRGGNYAITRPAREMLFTYVDKDTRFKAKQVIDIIVYRGGDVFWGWAFTFLTAVIGLGVAGVALVGAGIAAVWAMLGLYLGNYTKSLDNKQSTD
ncbi:MAG: MFS transporter [Gammaproteobacteria bacterium]